MGEEDIMTKIKYKKNTLKRQFVQRMLIVLIIISGLSGAFQYYYLSMQIKSNVNEEATKIAHSIEQGIKETDTASGAIENQLDLKLKVIAERISDRLGSKTVDEISNEELLKISKEFGISGITLFVGKDNDLVGAKSTSPSDIGFGFKKILGPDNPGFINLINLLNREKIVKKTESYTDQNTIVLYSSQSGSNEKPTFYKYAYYHGKGQNYVINPYIQANEVYHFTEKVGPNSWIENVLNTNAYAKEVAVLDPRVYANPKLAQNLYPPLKKVVYGEFNLFDKKDEKTLISLAKKPKSVAYIIEKDSTKINKVFIPMKNGQVTYIALDYTLMSEPFLNIAKLLLLTSFISLLALFILSTRFFSSIYRNIQAIITQIKRLEHGDFTAQSEVIEKGELADLSASTNHMTNSLNNVLKETTKEAEKVQNLSLVLKAEADESVEKMYALSIDITSNSRHDAFEISDFLDMLEEKMHTLPEMKTGDMETILSRIEHVRNISNNHSESTTDITITLSDLLKSLQTQSAELSEISGKLFENMYKFKLK